MSDDLHSVDYHRVSDTGQGWVAYVVEDPDGEDETTVATYCPVCAEREFQ